MGHEDQLPPPRLSGRRQFGEATFAGISGKEEDRRKRSLVSKRFAAIDPKFEGFITGSSLSRF